MAKIVVFEGPDKVGKETQSKLCQEAFAAANYRAIRIEVPSKACPRSYKLIYWMLRNGWAKRVPNAFQFVQFLNKWLFQVNVLPSLLRNADIVIFDRWSLSAVIYGNATGVNERFNVWLYNRLRKADVTIVMCDKSFRRASTQDDSYEKDSELQTRVRDGYREWAVMHADDHILVKNDKPVKDIHHDILIELSMCGVP
jgi:thymidylate kinase